MRWSFLRGNCVLALIALLFCLAGQGIYAQSSSSTEPPVSVAVFPLVSTGMPPSGTVGVIDPSLIQKDITAGISASASGPFKETDIETPPQDFDPGVPPDPSAGQGATYSMTSQLFYDQTGQQTQGQIWLYDNITGELVVTDQFVFPIVGSTDGPDKDAAAMSAAMVDYILGRIPVYTLTVTVGAGGTVMRPGSATGISSTGRGGAFAAVQPSYLLHGSQNVSLNAVPARGYRFRGWRINSRKELITTPTLDLALNSKNYPGKVSGGDPWGTKVSVRVEALFSPGPDAETGQAAKLSSWYVAAGWLPAVHLTGKGDDFFNQAFFPLGWTVRGGFLPWQWSWGSIGAGAELGWTGMNGTHEKYSLRSNLVTAGAYALYRSMVFSRFLTVEGRLGGGMGLFWGGKTTQGAKTVGRVKKIASRPWLDAGASVWAQLATHISVGAGFDLRCYLFKDVGNSAFYLMPRVEAAWNF